MKPAWRTSASPSPDDGAFVPPPGGHIADAVASATSGVPGMRDDEPWLDINLPHRRLVKRLSARQVSELIVSLRDLLLGQERGTIAVTVELGAVLHAVRESVGHGRWLPWLRGSPVNVRTGQMAVRYFEWVGGDDGRVCVTKLAALLSRYGYAKFEGVTPDQIKPWDVTGRMLSATITAAERGVRAVEAAEDAKCATRCAFDHPGLREESKAAELKEVSLSSSAGAATSAPVLVHSTPQPPHGGGGRVGVAPLSGHLHSGRSVGAVSSPRADASAFSRGPAARDVERGETQMTLDAEYQAVMDARELHERLESGRVPDVERAFIYKTLRIALEAARRGDVLSGGSRGHQPPTQRIGNVTRSASGDGVRGG